MVKRCAAQRFVVCFFVCFKLTEFYCSNRGRKCARRDVSIGKTLYAKEIDIICKYETWNLKANRSTVQVLNVGSIWNMRRHPGVRSSGKCPCGLQVVVN